jgi:hypothetical protein
VQLRENDAPKSSLTQLAVSVVSPSGFDDRTTGILPSGDMAATLIPPPTMSVSAERVKVTVAPGQAAAGVKLITAPSGWAKTGKPPANATTTMSNTIEIPLQLANPIT